MPCTYNFNFKTKAFFTSHAGGLFMNYGKMLINHRAKTPKD